MVSFAQVRDGSSAWLKKADRRTDAVIAGVISTAPGVTLGANLKPKMKAAQRPLALAGRVPVKVNLEGGPIVPGDLLTLSDVPGMARKATGSDVQTIGIALSPFDGGRDGKAGIVTVLVQNRGSQLGTQQMLESIQVLSERLDNLSSENQRLWQHVNHLEKRLKTRRRSHHRRRTR